MIRPAAIFQDHMVLQQGKPIHIWGECDTDGEIRVEIKDNKVNGKCESGKWHVVMPAMEAETDLEMAISAGDQRIVVADVAVGEVWYAGGQSNMEFYLRYDRERENAIADKDIRMFDFPKISYPEEIHDYDYSDFGRWRLCTPENFDYFSAAAYYFAHRIKKELGVAVGIVSCTWGATPACAWTDPEYLRGNEGKIWIEDYERNTKDLDTELYEENFRNNPDNYKGKPFSNPMMEKMMYGMTNEELMAWVQEMAQSGSPAVIPMEGPKSEKRPGGLFENMVKHAAPYTIRGFIWYQGENDDFHPEVYHTVLSQLINCYRDLWGETLPFFFVQLAPFSYWVEEGRSIFPMLRREQEWVAENTEFCWMASVMDHGMEHDIHPKEKRPVGERLALLALGHVYDKRILCDPPKFESAEAWPGQISLYFKNAGEGLFAEGDEVEGLRVTVDGVKTEDTEILVDGNTITLKDKLFTQEADVRVLFAQEDYCRVNLYNSAKLSMLPFMCELKIERR